MDAVQGPSTREAQLTRLVEQYQTPLAHICCMILHDDALAEDAVQETFIKAYRAADAFRGECSEKTWLMRIAVNVCRDMRRARWFRYVDRRVMIEKLPIASASAFDEEGAEKQDLAQAILRLPARHREVILLYYYQNMNIKEVAQAVGIAPSSASNRLNKAREKLRTLMEGRDDRG